MSSLAAGGGELLEISNSWGWLVSTEAVLAFSLSNRVEAGGGCSATDKLSQPRSYNEVSPRIQVFVNEHKQGFHVPLLGLAPKTAEVHSCTSFPPPSSWNSFT